MGLDISTKNDYARFNWSGARGFLAWNKEKIKIDPFPSWQGGNGEFVVFNREPENEREVRGDTRDAQKWIKAFEGYVGTLGDEHLLEQGRGRTLGEVIYRAYEIGVKDTCEKNKLKDYEKDFLMSKPELIEWEYLQAIKWYFVLKDGIENGSIFYG